MSATAEAIVGQAAVARTLFVNDSWGTFADPEAEEAYRDTMRSVTFLAVDERTVLAVCTRTDHYGRTWGYAGADMLDWAAAEVGVPETARIDTVSARVSRLSW